VEENNKFFKILQQTSLKGCHFIRNVV